MVRTNGSEPNTRVTVLFMPTVRLILPVVRATGASIIGRAVQNYLGRALLLAGRFGEAGKASMDWHAVRK